MKFEINEKQMEKFRIWKSEVSSRAAEKQHKEDPEGEFPFYPYYGAIGGGFIFSFVPTSLGEVITVEESITGECLDLTEYDSW